MSRTSSARGLFLFARVALVVTAKPRGDQE